MTARPTLLTKRAIVKTPSAAAQKTYFLRTISTNNGNDCSALLHLVSFKSALADFDLRLCEDIFFDVRRHRDVIADKFCPRDGWLRCIFCCDTVVAIFERYIFNCWPGTFSDTNAFIAAAFNDKAPNGNGRPRKIDTIAIAVGIAGCHKECAVF